MEQQSIVLDPIKTKHRAMWALGDYDRIATEVIYELGGALVDAASVQPGELVLDVAAGSGNASLPAAIAGARVVATDLTPELVQIGRERAAAHALDITWQEADAEHLPFADGEFDVVLSCVGVMFAPFHQPVADELVRVTRAGGRIGLINWTPSGLHRSAVRHHEAVQPAAAGRSDAGSALGRRSACAFAVRRCSHRTAC